MLAVAVGGETAYDNVEAGLPARDEIEHRSSDDCSHDLRYHVRAAVRRLGSVRQRAKTDRNRRVQMAAGDVADRVGHRQHGQAEGERDAEQADPDVRKCRREHGTATPSQHKPERSNKFSTARG